MMRQARRIVEDVCLEEGISVQQLWEGKRTKTISSIRAKIIALLKDHTTLSWREIGMMVGLNSKPTKQYAASQNGKNS